MSLCCGPEQLQIEMPVAIGVKARSTVVASLQDVQRNPGQV
jgi:hypothetical protein